MRSASWTKPCANGLPHGHWPDLGFFRQAIAHVYFAAFHAAQGLLAIHGMEPSIHEGVQRLIGLHFVVAGRLSKEAGRALSALLARRHEADLSKR